MPEDAVALSSRECEALIESETSGHIALTVNALPVVMPIDYRWIAGNVVFAMRDGPLQRALVSQPIALEIDRVHPSNWMVVVVGMATEVTDPAQQAACRDLGLRYPSGARTVRYFTYSPEIISGYTD